MENIPIKGLPPLSRHGIVEELAHDHYRLSLQGGHSGSYRLAQVDDQSNLRRSQFHWRAPCTMELKARVSMNDIPGTWGFGFWNDPFTASLGLKGAARHVPALPNTAWFFYASPPNYLALCNDHPAQGFLAATFSSPTLPTLLLAPGMLALPSLAWRPTARLLRRLARSLIHEDAAALQVDVTQWHTYRLDLNPRSVCFSIDGHQVAETPFVPRGPLARVLWIDNQYAAFTPDGSLKSGALANPSAWLEIKTSD